MVKHKLVQISVQLGIPLNKIKEFKKEDDPLSEVIDYWLKGNVKGVPLTWKSIVKALESTHVDEEALAERIKKTYCHNEGDEQELNDNSEIHIAVLMLDYIIADFRFVLSRINHHTSCCFNNQLRYSSLNFKPF